MQAGREAPQIRVSPRPPGWWGRLAYWLPAAALLVPATMLSLVAWLTWRDAMAEAFSQMVRSAEATAEYGDRALESYLVAVARANDLVRGLTDAQIREQEQALHEALARQLTDARGAAFSTVTDRQGQAMVGSRAYPIPRTDLSARDYVRTLAPAGRPPVTVTPLFIGLESGRLQFAVARPRTGSAELPDANGFEGVVLVTVGPEMLAANMRRLAVPPDYLALVREDGHTLARTAGEQRMFPPIPQDSPFHRLVASGATAATYVGVNMSDGSPVLTALRRLDNFPVYAAALRPHGAVVAAWRRSMRSHLLFGVPATLGLFALSLLVRANQKRLTEANVTLRLDARRSETRLRRAEQMGLFGSFEIDLRTGENFRSAEYMAVQGLPALARMESHQDWVARLHPEDRERAEAVMMAAVSPGSSGTEYAQTYRIITPEGQTRWIAARAEIERDADGHALAMRGAHVDVTSLREAERALADSDARLRLAQEAAGIGTWEWEADGETRLSRRMRELWGYDHDDPQPGAEAFLARIHPEDRARLAAEKQAALQGGLLRSECRVVRPRPDGGEDMIWVMLRASAQRGHGAARLIGIGYDVTDRKQAEADAALLAHEVEHRARNALTVVTGMLRVTQADSVEEFAEVMEERVSALSRTMSLLGRNRFRGAELRALLEHELRPYGAAVTLQGEAAMLSAVLAQSLSLALHELATNAAKYGALSSPNGRLRVAWQVEGDEMTILWEERGGPMVRAAPEREGFGSTLITQTFADRLSGGIEREWRPGGLFCRIRVDLRTAD